MTKIYSILRKLYPISLILSIILVSIRSPIESDDKFTAVDYYKSFTKPIECFKVYHNNPVGPRFMLAAIGYEITPSKKNIRKKYQLKRANRPCKSSIKLPIIKDRDSKITLGVDFYFYYKENFTALFWYNLIYGFDNSPMIIVSTKNQFGLQVEFSNVVDENSFTYDPELPEVKSYLLSIPKNNGLICLLTQNNRQLVLSRDNLPIRDDGIIVRLRIEYIKNGNVVLMEDHPAFDCYQEYYKNIETVFLIHEGHEYDIHVSLIYSNLDKFPSYTKLTDISFSNIKLTNINNLKYLSKNVNKLFFLKVREILIPCPSGVKSRVLKSESDIPYHATTDFMIKVSTGAKRKKWFSHAPESPCD